MKQVRLVRTNGAPLTRADLDEHRCSHAEHAIDLGPSCHRGAAMTAFYVPTNGRLALRCVTCGTIAAVIQVAGAVPS